jgi:hypothetical protein
MATHMQALNAKEKQIFDELARIAGADVVVTAERLHEEGFPDFVADVYSSTAVFRQSLENRKLQILQAKGYIKMQRGIYTIISRQ